MRAVMDGNQVEQLESTSEARIGDSNAMGLFGFAIGTTLVAWVLSGWAAMPGALAAVVPPLLIFSGVAQFVAGLYAFSRTHSWAGTTLCSYGALYAVAGAAIWGQAIGAIPRLPGDMIVLAVGLFCASYLSLAFTIGAMRINRSYAMMTAAMTIALSLAGVQLLGSNRELGFLAGYFMLVAAFFAFYAATAHVVNCAWREEALPLGTIYRDRGRRGV